MDKKTRQGYGFALGSAFTGAVMAVCAKWVLETVSPLALACLVNVAASALLTFYLHARSAWGRLETLRGAGWKWLLALCALFFFAILTYWLALDLLDATIVSFLNRLETVIIIVLGVGLLGERFRRGEMAGGALVIVGMVLIRYAGGSPISLGYWLVVVSAVLFGVVEVVAKRAVEVVDPAILTWSRNVILSILFGAVWIWREGSFATGFPPALWGGIVLVALTGPVLSRLFYLKALERIEVSKTALISQSQPLWVALLAFLVLGDRMSGREWGGGALILTGCVLLILRRGKGISGGPASG